MDVGAAIRRYTIRFETEGEAEAKRAADVTFDALAAKAKAAGAEVEKADGKITSVASSLNRIKAAADPSFVAAQRLARELRTFEAARGQGLFGQGLAANQAEAAALAAINRQYEYASVTQAKRIARENEAIEAARRGMSANDNFAASLHRVSDGYHAMTGALIGLGVAGFGAAMVRDIIDTSRRFETLRASIETVTGSAGAAATAFGALKQFAVDSPAYGLEEATQGFIKLKSLGLDPGIAALTSYGNTASAMGKSLDQMVEAVADAVTGENERLKEFGIRASIEGNKVTYTFRGVSTTINRSAEAIEAYLRRIGDVQFAGAMERQAGTLGGAFSNLGDSVSSLMDDIGRAGFAGAVSEAARALAQLSSDQSGAARWIGAELGDAVKDVTGYFEAWASALRTVNDVMAKLPSGQLPSVPDLPFWNVPAQIGMGAANIGGEIGMWLRQQVGLSTPGENADPRFNNAFDRFGKAGEAATELQKKLTDLALKGVPTLEDRIARATADPTNVIYQASQGRLRYDQASGLDKTAASQLAAAIVEAQARGLAPVVTEAFRTFADQAKLYADRANNPNPVAAPGNSAHERGVAVDISLKGMSDEQLRILKEIMDKYGFNQPVANDPVHWLFGGEAGTKFLRDQEDALAKAQMGWQDYMTGLKAGTSDIAANTAMLGRSIAQIEAERVVREGLARAKQSEIPVTDALVSSLEAEGQARGAALNAQATAQFMQQVSQRTADLTDAVAAQAAIYGRSAEQVERDRVAREMWAQVQAQGLTVTPQLTAFVDQEAAAQARASTAYQHAAEQAQAAQEAMGAFGNAAMSVLDALRQPADNLAESLGGIVMQIGDMTTAAVLFGQGPFAQVLGFAGQDGQQGGLFGALMGNDLTGFGEVVSDATRKGTRQGFGDIAGTGQPMDLTGGQAGQQTGLLQQIVGGIGGLAAIGSGYFAGMQSGDPIMGAASGAISGLAGGAAIATLPMLAAIPGIGWLAGGIGALVGGALGFAGGNSVSNHDEEQARRAQYFSQYSARQQFIAAAGGDAYGTIESTLDEGFSKMRDLASTIEAMKDPTGQLTLELNELERAYGKLGGRLNTEFKRAFDATIDSLVGGQGLSSAFETARGGIMSLKDDLRGFVADTTKVYGSGSAEEAAARAASQQFALSQLAPADPLSAVATKLQEMNGRAIGLQQTLEDLGKSADDASAAISSGVTAALTGLRGDFVTELDQMTNTALDKGYLNDAAALIKQRSGYLNDASLLGLDSSAVDRWFGAAAQALVNDAELTGSAFADLTAQFPELTGAVTAFSAALTRTEAEIASAISGYEDRLFAAVNDNSTLAGQIAAIDRQARREREAEIAAGGAAIVQLEAALAAERRRAITDGIQSAFDGAVSAFGSLESALSSAQDGLRSAITSMQDFVGGVADFRAGLRLSDDLTVLDPLAKLTEAQRQYETTLAAARLGDKTAMAGLTGSAQDYLGIARDYYSADANYADIFKTVNAGLSGIEDWGNAQIDQGKALVDLNSTADTIAQAIAKLSTAQADYDLGKAQIAQMAALGAGILDVANWTATLNGTAGSGLATIAASLATVQYGLGQINGTLAGSIAQAGAGTGVAGGQTTDMVTWLYRSVLGREPDAQGYADWWTHIRNDGTLAANVVGEFTASAQRELAMRGMRLGGLVGAYAGGGIVGNGLWDVDSVIARYAGGGSIALAGGEYVMPAAQTGMYRGELDAMRAGTWSGGAGLGTDNRPVVDAIQTGFVATHRAVVENGRLLAELVDEVRALREENAALRREARHSAGDPRLKRA